MRVGGTWTASWVDLSPSLNRKYSGPMKTRVKITTTSGQHDPVDDRPRGRFSWALEISVLACGLHGMPVA